jgi:hypothetical protein
MDLWRNCLMPTADGTHCTSRATGVRATLMKMFSNQSSDDDSVVDDRIMNLFNLLCDSMPATRIWNRYMTKSSLHCSDVLRYSNYGSMEGESRDELREYRNSWRLSKLVLEISIVLFFHSYFINSFFSLNSKWWYTSNNSFDLLQKLQLQRLEDELLKGGASLRVPFSLSNAIFYNYRRDFVLEYWLFEELFSPRAVNFF